MDGFPHLVVDGTETVTDLTGWTAELRRDWDGRVTVEPFESREAPRLPGGEVSVNPYSSGDWVSCWVLNVENEDVVAFIDPNGVRYCARRGPSPWDPRL